MRIGTLTTGAGVVTTINLTYLPERVAYVAPTQLTGFRCEVLGEGVICDLDAAGLNALGRHRKAGLPTNGYEINLADGKIMGKNVVLTFTNSAAQTPDIYAYGVGYGTGYIVSTRAVVFANQPATFTRFATLFLPSLAATDKVQAAFVDGLSETLEREDLAFYSGDFQNVTGYLVDNLNGDVDEVTVIAGTQQMAYVVKYESSLM